MNKHNYTKRVGPPGEDLWQCQAPDCRDKGPLKELMVRPCPHVLQPGEAEENLLAALEASGTKRDASPCGCEWVRLPPGGPISGDVIVKPCAGHTPDPLKITMTDLAVLAGEVAAGNLTEDEAASRVADLCTQHGPAAVQALDAYYEIELQKAMAR